MCVCVYVYVELRGFSVMGLIELFVRISQKRGKHRGVGGEREPEVPFLMAFFF